MKISTKGRYALRLMLDLAIYNTGEPTSLKDVARRQKISEKYLEQIIAVLNRGGLVKSIRGAQGGYVLKKQPKDIKVGDILRLTEGDLAPVACVGQDPEECDMKSTCVTIFVWNKLAAAISDVVDNITLQDLVDESQAKADSYVI